MTVLNGLKPSTPSAVGNDDRVLRNKFFCLQFPGGRDTINCQMPDPGTHRASNVGGMLAAGIDSHIKGEHIRTVNWG